MGFCSMNVQRIVEYDYFMCDTCREYVYNEAAGDNTRGIDAKTHVEMLPTSWRCPICGAGKEKLRAATLSDYFTYDERSVEKMARSRFGQIPNAEPVRGVYEGRVSGQ